MKCKRKKREKKREKKEINKVGKCILELNLTQITEEIISMKQITEGTKASCEIKLQLN